MDVVSEQATFKGWMDIMYAAVDSQSKVITFMFLVWFCCSMAY